MLVSYLRDVQGHGWLPNVPDDLNREGLGIEIEFSLPAERVVRASNQIIEWRGAPCTIRVGNSP